jgi:hypothetical protein
LPLASSVAGMRAKAEFFEPLIATVPFNFLPPVMTNLSTGFPFCCNANIRERDGKINEISSFGYTDEVSVNPKQVFSAMNMRIRFTMFNPYLNRAIAQVHAEKDKYDACMLAHHTQAGLLLSASFLTNLYALFESFSIYELRTTRT